MFSDTLEGFVRRTECFWTGHDYITMYSCGKRWIECVCCGKAYGLTGYLASVPEANGRGATLRSDAYRKGH